jgi:hypothetical protein
MLQFRRAIRLAGNTAQAVQDEQDNLGRAGHNQLFEQVKVSHMAPFLPPSMPEDQHDYITQRLHV